MTLGQNIARLRTQKNLSQGDLADALEVSRQSVSKWETDASIPELDKLLRLAELFGVTLDELVKGESAQPEAARGEVPDKESAGAYTAAAPGAPSSSHAHFGMGRNSWKSMPAMHANATTVQTPKLPSTMSS